MTNDQTSGPLDPDSALVASMCFAASHDDRLADGMLYRRASATIERLTRELTAAESREAVLREALVELWAASESYDRWSLDTQFSFEECETRYNIAKKAARALVAKEKE